jgi:ATP-dependent Lhr-like helicase
MTADTHAALCWAHPLVREWFTSKFGSPTEPQEQGWPHILAGHTTLISAPTGSGKTLAAFLACIDRLIRKALSGTLEDRTEVLYVSPLKALGNDIQKNLEVPLAEILQLAGRRGLLMPEIRTAVRTGDTLMSERRAMLKRPPHILVTTPESLYILLTAEKSRALLRDVETVIVDEIHAVAGSKRGAHLALSLERLEQLTGRSLVRIGLSATQKPLDEIAGFLSGLRPSALGRRQEAADAGEMSREDIAEARAAGLEIETCCPRPKADSRGPIAVVDIGHHRQMDLGIEVPRSELEAVATNEMWEEIYDRLAELVRGHRSTLVFVNTRRLAERVAMHLAERLGEEAVAAHHGSLSRKLRLAAEAKLKHGEVAVLVATASLELGIDIGFVDLAVQIGSTRSIAVALQRFGRSGHWKGAIPKARLFVTTRDELLECAALIRAIHHGELDRILIPEAPLDVLAQQIVAECASNQRSPSSVPRPPQAPELSSGIKRVTANIRQITNGAIPLASDQPTARRGRRPTTNDDTARDGGQETGDGVSEESLYALVTRAYPYRGLARGDFDQIIAMLSDGMAARRGRYGAYLHRDRLHGVVRPRRGARLAAITSGGAIPGNSLFTMISLPEGAMVGTLDEDFAVESNAGDIILLGNTSWRIRRVEGSAGRVLVEDAHGAPPTVPFWRGEAPARTAELSAAVANLRQRISGLLPHSGALAAREINKPVEVLAAIDWLKSECGLDDSGAEQAIDHVLMGRAVLGVVPTQKTVVAERFFDEGGGMQLVIHAPFGARVNKAWGLALRKRFCRSFNFELQAAATDDGLNISLAEQHSFPLADVFHYLSPETVKEVLEQAILTAQSPIFASRWRWDAERSLALLRFQHGKKVPPQIQRIRADDLLASVFPDVAACFENIEGDIRVPDHPLVREVMKDVLHEAMDLDTLVQVLRGIENGDIRCIAVDTPAPSQFAHEILNANPYAYLDDAPLEERRARAVEMRRMLPESVLQEVGWLDPEAIAQVRQEAWPDVRDADELQDVLQTLVAVPASIPGVPRPPSPVSRQQDIPSSDNDFMVEGFTANWQPFFDPLVVAKRAGLAEAANAQFWVAAERAATFETLYPDAHWLHEPGKILEATQVKKVGDGFEWETVTRAGGGRGTGDGRRDEALTALVTGWLMHCGPVTAEQLAETLRLPVSDIDQALLRIESSGAILRGQFTRSAPGSPTEWCERRLLARIHRLTIGRLRKEIEPVTPAEFMRWLLHWQHLAPGTQLHGERGTLEVLQQLQGFEIPANAWERQILARRIADYDPEILDRLCLTGAVGWGRLSPHPAILDSGEGNASAPATRRVIPTSVAPITFFVREDAGWMPNSHADTTAPAGLSATAHKIYDFLQQRGASFFTDIVRGTFELKAGVETGLWELVTAGLVTADGFDNLRALIDPKRRSGQGHGRMARPRHSTGRWSVLYPAISASPSAAEARAAMVESTCWMLLRRYGVVFRDLLAREAVAPKWRELQLAFRRLEDRGEIRGGRFISGFLGEQFALPVAVESLRAERKHPTSGETITLSAADPLNLIGIVVPGERVPALSGKYVALRDGVAVEAIEHRVIPATMAGIAG